MCAAKCRSGRRTSRRDTWRRSSQVRPPRPGSVLRPPRNSPCPTVTPAVSREPGVSSADSVRMSLGLGQAQHPTLTDAQQRVIRGLYYDGFHYAGRDRMWDLLIAKARGDGQLEERKEKQYYESLDYDDPARVRWEVRGRVRCG